MAEKDETKAFAREVGARSVGQLEGGLARLVSDSSAMGRWILGSLVTLNGGGILAMATGREAFSSETIETAISLFVIGASLAVISALASMIAAQFIAPIFGEAITYWSRVATSGENIEEAVDAARRLKRAGLAYSIAPIGSGLLSLILFVAGAMTLASGLVPSTAPVEEVAPAVSVGTPPIQAPTPAPAQLPVPTETPAPEPKATPKPEPEQKRAPRRAPRPAPPEPATAPAPVAPPPAASPPAAAPQH